MSDHTDGPEPATAGKKRMLEGHAPLGGPQGERHKHEERGVNLANASGVATALAPHPSAAKKPRKPALCLHQRVRSMCKDCGGSSICEHQRRKSECKDCGGSGLQRLRRQTPTCRRDQKNVPDAHTINTIVKK